MLVLAAGGTLALLPKGEAPRKEHPKVPLSQHLLVLPVERLLPAHGDLNLQGEATKNAALRLQKHGAATCLHAGSLVKGRAAGALRLRPK